MNPFQVLADVVLAVHVAIVLFVVGGLVVILVGNARGWAWVNRSWFRIAHIAAIGVVAAQAWFGVICPLTTLEMWLRRRAGGDAYEGSFIEHWFETLLYYDAPAWVFTVAYTAFGLLVVAAWLRYPPRRARRPDRTTPREAQDA
ncbi:MAG: DUF2784 domain-containing protein [Acidobacteria bacterium]|nr:DUF2784 domain-containing protein [Acidobacteriota bacterium]